MYQRTQAQSDFPVENAKNLLKEINEEYNVRAVSCSLIHLHSLKVIK
jgi:hypothetical protein